MPGSSAVDHVRAKRIDAFRAIAALSVLISHASHLSGRPHSSHATQLAGRLGSGVWLFFAVSGFLIAGPFLRAVVEGRPLPSFGRYAVRRAARILPAYWVGLAAILLLATAGTVAHWWQIPIHALLLQSLVPHESQQLYFVAWTLGLEAIFYALVPLAAYVAWRATRGRGLTSSKAALCLLGVWAFTFATQAMLGLAYPVSGSEPGLLSVVRSMAALGNFCPGMLVFLAARESHGLWHRAYRAMGRQPLLTIAAGAVSIYIAQELPWRVDAFAAAVQRPLMGIGSGLILAAVIQGNWLRRTLAILAPIGLISYGIYLWHWVIVATFERHGLFPITATGSVGTLANVVLLLGLALPLALASWMLVERPLLMRTTGWERSRSRLNASPQAHSLIEKAPFPGLSP